MSWLKSKLPVLGFVVVIVFGLLLVRSILFPHKDILQGVIVEKLYVPGKFVAGPNVLSFNHYKSHDYLITTQAHDQWLALVNTEEGTIMVHCDSVHYQTKQVGDVLHFKKYTGEILGIEYMSHYEEDNGLSFYSIIKKVF